MLNLNLWFIVPKNVSKPLLPHPLGQSPSFDQFEFWPLRRWRTARAMPFYLGALRMLNIATGYSKNTLSCSELNEEHAGEGFRSLRHILTPLWACKAKKCHFSRKFDLWPDLTRSNIDLGPKTICAIARSRRGASTGSFREALRPSGADRQGGRTNPPPPLTVRVMRNALTGRGLISRRSVPPRGVHVRTCRCTPHQTCAKQLSNGSLFTHKIWTRPDQPFASLENGARTCARADALHLRHV